MASAFPRMGSGAQAVFSTSGPLVAEDLGLTTVPHSELLLKTAVVEPGGSGARL